MAAQRETISTRDGALATREILTENDTSEAVLRDLFAYDNLKDSQLSDIELVVVASKKIEKSLLLCTGLNYANFRKQKKSIYDSLEENSLLTPQTCHNLQVVLTWRNRLVHLYGRDEFPGGSPHRRAFLFRYNRVMSGLHAALLRQGGPPGLFWYRYGVMLNARVVASQYPRRTEMEEGRGGISSDESRDMSRDRTRVPIRPQTVVSSRWMGVFGRAMRLLKR